MLQYKISYKSAEMLDWFMTSPDMKHVIMENLTPMTLAEVLNYWKLTPNQISLVMAQFAVHTTREMSTMCLIDDLTECRIAFGDDTGINIKQHNSYRYVDELPRFERIQRLTKPMKCWEDL